MKFFAKKGFYHTTIPLLAKELKMSVGNIYNYFPSKIYLAKSAVRFASDILTSSLHKINQKNISAKEKIGLFVQDYLEITQVSPEVIEFFLRVYLSNRDLFEDNENGGFQLAEAFVKEVEVLLQYGMKHHEFRKSQDFFISFSVLTGILGAFTFLSGENILKKDIVSYRDEIADAIYKGLS
ncbi:TetR/AcrR family transcriptional regulator [Hydrogenimonas sp.]